MSSAFIKSTSHESGLTAVMDEMSKTIDKAAIYYDDFTMKVDVFEL